MTGAAIDIVKPADLPRSDDGKMQKIIVAFDVDGTLVMHHSDAKREHGVISATSNSVPVVPWINTLQVLSTCKNVKIVVWSGGGKQYAEAWGRRLGLDKYVWYYASKLEHPTIKAQCEQLIVVDDIQATRLGDANLIVKNK